MNVHTPVPLSSRKYSFVFALICFYLAFPNAGFAETDRNKLTLKRIASLGFIDGLVWNEPSFRVQNENSSGPNTYKIFIDGAISHSDWTLTINASPVSLNKNNRFSWQQVVKGPRVTLQAETVDSNGETRTQTLVLEITKQKSITKLDQIQMELANGLHTPAQNLITLENLVSIAIENSEEAAILHSRESEFSTEKARALIDFLPQVNLEVQHAFIKPQQSGLTNFFMMSFAGVRFYQSIFDGGLRMSKYRLSDAKKDESTLRLEQLRQETRRVIAPLFFEAAFCDNKIILTKKRLELINDLVSWLQSRADNFAAPKMDKALLISEQHRLETLVGLTELEKDDAVSELKRQLRISSEEDFDIKLDFPRVLEADLGAFDESKNPEVKVLENLTHQAEIEKSIASSEFLPQVQVLGQYGVLPRANGDFLKGDDPSWAVGVKVSIPLMGGIEGFFTRHQYEERFRQSTLKLEGTKKDRKRQRAFILNRLDFLKNLMKHLDEPIRELGKAVQSERTSVLTGEKGIFVWLGSFTKLYDMEIDRLIALKNYSLALTELYSIYNKPLNFSAISTSES